MSKTALIVLWQKLTDLEFKMAALAMKPELGFRFWISEVCAKTRCIREVDWELIGNIVSIPFEEKSR
jgi:hypothetical protein